MPTAVHSDAREARLTPTPRASVPSSLTTAQMSVGPTGWLGGGRAGPPPPRPALGAARAAAGPTASTQPAIDSPPSRRVLTPHIGHLPRARLAPSRGLVGLGWREDAASGARRHRPRRSFSTDAPVNYT